MKYMNTQRFDKEKTYYHIGVCMKAFGYNIQNESVSLGVIILILVSILNNDIQRIGSLLVEIDETLYPIYKRLIKDKSNTGSSDIIESSFSTNISIHYEEIIYKIFYKKILDVYSKSNNISEIKNLFFLVKEFIDYAPCFLPEIINRFYSIYDFIRRPFPICRKKTFFIKNDEIAILSKFTGLYTREELVFYFKIFINIFIYKSYPITILLNKGNDCVLVGILKEKRIIIYDNYLYEIDSLNIEKFVERVFFNSIENGYIVMNSMIFVEKLFISEASKSLLLWRSHPYIKNIHLLTREKAKIVDSEGYSLLFKAIIFNHIYEVRKILQHGADPNIKNIADGFSPIAYACQNGFFKIVKLLVSSNADINIQTNEDTTPLMLAVANNHIKIVNYLLNKGANLHLTNHDGINAFMLAVKNGYVNIVKILLDHNVNPDQVILNDYTPLMIASKYGYVEMAKLLLDRGVNPDRCDLSENTSLLISIDNNNIEVVKVLLAANADPNIARDDGITPLILSAYKNNHEIVNLLIKNGAIVNTALCDGSTAITAAIIGNSIESLKTLIAHGANLHQNFPEEIDPFFIVAESGYTEIAKILLSNGISQNKYRDDRMTPMMIAAKNGHKDLFHLLKNENKFFIDSDYNDRSISITTLIQLSYSLSATIIFNEDFYDLDNQLSMILKKISIKWKNSTLHYDYDIKLLKEYLIFINNFIEKYENKCYYNGNARIIRDQKILYFTKLYLNSLQNGLSE